MKKRIYELLVLLLAAVLVYSVLFGIGDALKPDRQRYGSIWSSYLQEPEDSVDVLFLGSSRTYCNVSPARIYEDCGVTSFVMAGPAQTTSMTYYYLKECLKTQSPKAVYVELSAAYYGKYEDYSLVNVSYMPLSWNRVMAAAHCEEGIMTVALYPLEEFHSRVYSVLDGIPDGETGNGVLLCGFTPMFDANPQAEKRYRPTSVAPGDAQYMENLDYLQRIAALCEENDCQCVFFLAPTMQPFYDEWNEQLFSDLAALPSAEAENWDSLMPALQIDDQTDWYDSIHFNQFGAMKFSDYLADELTAHGLTPTANADPLLWQQRIDHLHELLEKKSE